MGEGEALTWTDLGFLRIPTHDHQQKSRQRGRHHEHQRREPKGRENQMNETKWLCAKFQPLWRPTTRMFMLYVLITHTLVSGRICFSCLNWMCVSVCYLGIKSWVLCMLTTCFCTFTLLLSMLLLIISWYNVLCCGRMQHTTEADTNI